MDTLVKNLRPEEMLALGNLVLTALGTKLLALIALVMTFALFCYAMWKGTVLAFILAAVFGLSVLLPVLYTGWKRIDT